MCNCFKKQGIWGGGGVAPSLTQPAPFANRMVCTASRYCKRGDDSLTVSMDGLQRPGGGSGADRIFKHNDLRNLRLPRRPPILLLGYRTTGMILPWSPTCVCNSSKSGVVRAWFVLHKAWISAALGASETVMTQHSKSCTGNES